MGAIIHTGKQRIKHIGIEIDGIGHQPPDRQEQITSAKLLMTPTAWLRYGSGGGARGGGGTSPWLGRDRCRSALPLSAVLGPRRAARRDSRIWVNTEQGTVGLFCLSEQGTVSLFCLGQQGTVSLFVWVNREHHSRHKPQQSCVGERQFEPR